MSKKNFCRACHNLKQGVKTKVAVLHTCGLTDEQAKRLNWQEKLLDQMEKIREIQNKYP